MTFLDIVPYIKIAFHVTVHGDQGSVDHHELLQV